MSTIIIKQQIIIMVVMAYLGRVDTKHHTLTKSSLSCKDLTAIAVLSLQIKTVISSKTAIYL